MADNNEDWKLEYNAVLQGRRHEIDLFWRRSNIFWLITAATFAAFYKTYNDKGDPFFSIVIVNIGLVSSFCWSLVNRGSKFWMTSWELWAAGYGDDCFSGAHTELKEDWWVYRFSVSKLMIIISDFFTMLWLCLILYLLHSGKIHCCPKNLRDLITPITIFCLAFVPMIARGDDDKAKELKIKETEKEEGSFADVFFDKANGKAYKLFKGYHHPQSDKSNFTEEQYNSYRKNVFESEKTAYTLAINNRKIIKYVPLLQGTPKVIQVLDKNGKDISKNYLLDCCLVLEYIPGNSCKVGQIDREDFNKRYGVNLNHIIRTMNLAGIGFTVDMNVICNDDLFKLIDFATVDFITFQPEIIN